MKQVVRKSAVVAAAVVVSSFVLVEPATVSAAVTATTVTSITGVPAGYTIDDTDGAPSGQPTVTVTGTASAAVSGDFVDVRCYYGDDNQDDFNTLEGGVPVTSGMWTASGPLSNIAGYSCRLVAVPASSTFVLDDPSSAAFGRSKLLTVGASLTYTSTDGMGHATNYDYYLAILARNATNDVYSSTGCGPESTLVTTAPHTGSYLWDCMVALYHTDGMQDGDTQATDPVRINGHSAHTGYGLKNDAPSLPLSRGDLRYSVSQNKSTGAAVVMETDPYYFCETASHTIDDEVGPGDCATWLYSGVTLHRTLGFDHGGQAIAVMDRFVSTNKAKQSLSLEYESDVDSNDTVMRLPGDSGYSGRTDMPIDTASWPANGSLYVRSDPTVPNGSLAAPLGSVTWSTRPTSAYMFSPSRFFLNYTRSIPARGSFTLTHRFALAATAASLGSLSAAARRSNLPRLRLKHLPAKTKRPSLAVHGTVVDGGNGSITKVVATVGHRHYRAAVRHGVFTLHVRLKPGVDHIKVVGTDPARHRASAKATIRYRPRKSRKHSEARSRSTG